MLQLKYAFVQSKYPVGTTGETNLLVKFHPEITPPKRRPLNLCLVIDRSGSMAGSDLKYALNAAQSVIDQLDETDLISVVVFDDIISTIIHPQHPLNKKEIKEKVSQIRAGGMTNLSGGWLEGCKHVQANLNPQAVNRVILLTDGQANEGITNKDLLIKTAKQKAEEGIATTTLGFGSYFNEDLLVGMAQASGGNFYFIQDKNEAGTVFDLELQTLKAIVGQNLTITLKPEHNVQLLNVLSSREVIQNNDEYQVNLGDVFDDEDKLLGLVVQLPTLDALGVFPVLSLHYEVSMIENNEIKNIRDTLTITLPVVSMEEAGSAGTTGVNVELALLKIGNAKTIALKLADEGKPETAKTTLLAVIAELEQQGLNEKFEIAEEIEQLNYFATRFGKNNLSYQTRKELTDQAFQGLNRHRNDLAGRGTEISSEITALKVVQDLGDGVELVCVREGGKLRVKINHSTAQYDHTLNVQFPRAMRAEGARYHVNALEGSSDGSFYRVKGDISRLVKAGEEDVFSVSFSTSRRRASTGKAVKASLTLADLEVVNSVGDGVLVQCVLAGKKLRARVVSDGYESTWNMRFPRAIREENVLYVVDEILTAPDGKSYIACGTVKKFEQI